MNKIYSGFVIVIAIFLSSVCFAQDGTLAILKPAQTNNNAWSVPITISGSSVTLTRTFAGDLSATDGFDTGLDIVAPPPGMTYYAYFEIPQFPNYLDTDSRAWISPFNTNIDWTLKVVNATGITSSMSWNPTNLPSTGDFTLVGVNGPINMRTQSSVSFSGDKILSIQYRPGTGQRWSTPLTISGDGTNLSLTFGGDPNATNGFDSGLDLAAAPPGMTYYAYFEITQFPTYLSTDYRAWISPFQADIDWILKVVNATGKTSIISWNPANLPSQGNFTLEGTTSPVNMRTQTSVTFSGDKTLTIKYRSAGSSITVTSPNGNEFWSIGSSHNITWTSNNFTDPVKIEYSINGGTTWISPPIVSSTPNDGSHPWIVPNTPSTNCKVRISDAADGSPWDASDNVFTIGDAVDIWPPADTTGSANSVVNIPIYVRNVTNKGIYAVTLTVNTQTNVLTPSGATTTGTIANTWGVPTVNISGGDINISMAGATPLVGDGKQILIFIQYQVGSTQNAQTPIALSRAMFNEGQPAANITNGRFTIASYFGISGKINYHSNDKPVPQVQMSLSGAVTRSTYSDNLGNYTLTNLVGGNYKLKPGKVNDVAGAITAYDASMILRYAVGTVSLTAYQLIAGDVSKNGSVTSYDASYILRYCVGSITQFPTGKDWTFVPKNFQINQTNWASAPDSLIYMPLNSNQNNQDFWGILYGDVSGNWLGSNMIGSNIAVEFDIDNIRQISDRKWLVPVEVLLANSAYSGSFKLKFNETKLYFVSSSIVNSDYELLLATKTINDVVYCAFASAKSLLNQPIQINFFFNEAKSITPSPSDFQFLDVIIDDNNIISSAIANGSVAELPTEWQLNQNHPNPFNSETMIGYQVLKASYVTIDIYNLLGQKLRTLVNEDKDPGSYQILWNGKGELGQLVGSGIYIYKMQADGFNAIKKMVLIQ